MADLSQFMDFMEDDGGFDTPLIPSRAHPEGKKYHVSSPDGETGLRLSALADLSMKQQKGVELAEADIKRLRLNDQEERDFAQQVLGVELVDEMLADGVRWVHIKRLLTYAYTYFAIGQEAAQKAAEQGLFSGKVQTPNRATRRAAGTGAKRTTGASRASSSRSPKSV